MRFVSLLLGYLNTKVEASVKDAVAPLAPYLRKLAFGCALLFLATLCFSLTLCALTVALFFAFSHQATYSFAGLWIALIFAGVALLLAVGGITRLRPPR